ncbi:nuclear transport factor 2 family protein [Amycolatopsis jejuensis]|uniref:nuclear transport factor 2 family protein n=1 Tax=Amycolatopsis jejuensis TaxID=330084 RepID=UPI000525D5F4|nr:nuclear transport factor 2 family protein [Amycolatopsis jejuensis]
MRDGANPQQVLWELANRYSDAVTRKDAEAASRLWAVAGTWEIGAPFSVLATGPEEIAATLGQRISPAVFMLQSPGAAVVTDAGPERIEGRVHTQEIAHFADRTATIIGCYDDVVIQDEGEWRYASRRFTVTAVDSSPKAWTAVAGASSGTD